MYSDKAAKELTEEDQGRYYPLNASSVPEAFRDFYKDTTTQKGGCKGLQVIAPSVFETVLLVQSLDFRVSNVDVWGQKPCLVTNAWTSSVQSSVCISAFPIQSSMGICLLSGNIENQSRMRK